MTRRKKNLFGFGEKKKRVTLTPAQMREVSETQRKAMEYDLQRRRGGSGSASRSSASKPLGTASTTFKGYSIRRTEDGYVVPKIDSDTTFEDLTQAKRFISDWKKNPAKFERCVKAVKRKGGAANAYAVCTAAGARNSKRKWNPSEAAAKAYEDFHGRPSKESIVLTEKVHYHHNLASLGDLRTLVIEKQSDRPGVIYKVTLRFKPDTVFLCENEKRSQLFVEDGDQSVPLKQFGISPDDAHEMETLGDCRVVEYFTRKDHLGSEGGIAIYRHRFLKPYPQIIYDMRNKHIIFSGGGYDMPDEGIDG
jgi:hypothetical protein